MRHRPLRAGLRAGAFLLLNALLLPVGMVAALLWPEALRPLRRAWCAAVGRLLGVRVRHEGRPFAACPTLFVANHVSYLDIVVLGGLLDATFVAKAEIRSWPLFGTLARLTGTLFVRRHWREALAQRNAMAARMRAGESFILFAEGTSTDGLGIRPLKTSLLSVAEPRVLDCPIAIQPVTLAYVRLADGTPIDRANCHLYAWYGEDEFLPHLGRMLRLDGVELRVVLHEPVLSWSVRSRKTLGRELHAELARGLKPRSSQAEKKEARASFSDRTCVCGLAPRYDEHLNHRINPAKP